ncbi:uncharacterized protein LOC124893386 [Capsicum annuum]|uniref:uncharacterized protein LOC124893386 n=1 Tax=Capsicum annuum TaxID=4072 RepID=UPI001FB10D3F|nr:uncharacterized protein LOC124893386 [Capsicum annuum]
MGLNMAINLDIRELVVLGDSKLLIRQIQDEWETRDIKLIPYKQCLEDLSKMFKSIEFRYIPRSHNKLADALATLASMLPYPGNTYINPLEIQIQDQYGYCNIIDAEPDNEPWYCDIKCFLKSKEYPIHANADKKGTIRILANGFFLSGEILYKQTPNLNLSSCVNIQKAERIMNEVHSGVCDSHMNGYVLAKKIMQIIVEAEIDDPEWVKSRLEQLSLIDEKRFTAVFFGQLYQQRMVQAYNKKLTNLDEKMADKAINAGSVKRYYI